MRPNVADGCFGCLRVYADRLGDEGFEEMAKEGAVAGNRWTGIISLEQGILSYADQSCGEGGAKAFLSER